MTANLSPYASVHQQLDTLYRGLRHGLQAIEQLKKVNTNVLTFEQLQRYNDLVNDIERALTDVLTKSCDISLMSYAFTRQNEE